MSLRTERKVAHKNALILSLTYLIFQYSKFFLNVPSVSLSIESRYLP